MPNSKALRALVEEMRAGLRGAFPGAWIAEFGPQGGFVISDQNGFSLCTRTPWPLREPQSVATGLHIARCSPENIALLLTAAEAHLASSTDVEGWRTMDSAPRDGDEFQSWIVDDTGFGQWEPRSRFNPDTEAFELWGRVDYDQDGWEAYPHVTPTRWMPSPTPPAILPESPSPGKEGPMTTEEALALPDAGGDDEMFWEPNTQTGSWEGDKAQRGSDD